MLEKLNLLFFHFILISITQQDFQVILKKKTHFFNHLLQIKSPHNLKRNLKGNFLIKNSTISHEHDENMTKISFFKKRIG